MCLVLVACTVPTTSVVTRVPTTTPMDPMHASTSALSLRGDTGFEARDLSPELRELHTRMWGTLRDPANLRSARDQANSDDIYRYGRTFGGHVTAVLTALRVTGDLELLDYIDDLAERMRAELADGWRSTRDRTDGTRDGYLNWVYRYSATPSHQGKDTRVIDDIQTHAVVAHFAHAFAINSDQVSPAGIDYAERAEFWTDYLVNHFEAKWRERNDVPSGFPFIVRTQTTTYYAWTRWHYYMWKLTGQEAYLREAHAMAGNIWAEIRVVDGASGPAYVWASGLLELGDSQRRLQPTNYLSVVYGAIVDFHMEGFHNWASTDHMRAFTRTLTEFVIDSDDPMSNGFAPDIGGGVRRARLEVDRSSSRRTVDWFRTSQLGLIAAWDEPNGPLISLLSDAESIFTGEADTSILTSGLYLAHWLRSYSDAAHRD